MIESLLTWQPLGHQILVRPLIAADRTASGIVIPDAGKDRERPQTGLVLAVGPGSMDDGQFRACRVDVGDLVAFGKYAGVTFVVDDGEEILNMRDLEVLGRKTAGSFVLVWHEVSKGITTRMVAHETGVRCEHCPADAPSAVIAEERARLVKS
jgi:chaperonin GroES